MQKSENNTVVFPYPFVFVGEDSDEAINVNAETQRPTDVDGLTLTLTSPSAKSVAISKNADTEVTSNEIDVQAEKDTEYASGTELLHDQRQARKDFAGLFKDRQERHKGNESYPSPLRRFCCFRSEQRFSVCGRRSG